MSYAGASVASGAVTVTVTNACGTTPKSITVTINNNCNVWAGTTSIDWNLGSNWTGGTVPGSTDDVIIPASVASGRMPTISSSINVRNIANNGTITVASGGVLNSYGSIINNNAFTVLSGSTLAFKGSASPDT